MLSSHFAPLWSVPFGTCANVTVSYSWTGRYRIEAGGLVNPHGERGRDLLFAGQITRLDTFTTRCAADTPLTQNPSEKEITIKGRRSRWRKNVCESWCHYWRISSSDEDKRNVMTMMEGQRFKSTLTRLGRACYCSGQSRPVIGPLPCTGDLLRGPGLSLWRKRSELVVHLKNEPITVMSYIPTI